MKIRYSIILILAFLFASTLFVEAKKKVACVGNSITENSALSTENKYPTILQNLLGDEFEVRNYGIGGRTMLKKGNYPYWNEARYQEVLDWNPDIVIIKMGTNDAKPDNWKYKEEFKENYIEFVRSFQLLPSHPQVFICYPIPTFDGNSLSVSDSIITEEIIPIINTIAHKTKSKIIDFHQPLENKSDFVYDKIHPNVKGTAVMARIVAKAIQPKRKFPKPAVGQKLDIVFIGNSITEGTYLQSPPPTCTAMYLDSLGYEVNYFNCGMSGYTTVDFQPGKPAFAKIETAADSLLSNNGLLIFSVKLGTNDSASKGTSGAPVSPEQYEHNMQNIIDTLHLKYPGCRIIIHNPIWYSPNTHNSAVYLQEGLTRLESYSPTIESLAEKNKDFVVVGDKSGFNLFRKHYKKYHKAQNGNSGIFYLHPNAEGAMLLGKLWAKSIDKYVRSIKH